MNNQGDLKSNQSTNFEKRLKINQDIKLKQQKMVETKKREVEGVKE